MTDNAGDWLGACFDHAYSASHDPAEIEHANVAGGVIVAGAAIAADVLPEKDALLSVEAARSEYDAVQDAKDAYDFGHHYGADVIIPFGTTVEMGECVVDHGAETAGNWIVDGLQHTFNELYAPTVVEAPVQAESPEYGGFGWAPEPSPSTGSWYDDFGSGGGATGFDLGSTTSGHDGGASHDSGGGGMSDGGI